MAAFFSYLHSTCIKFSKFIISALTFYLQADFEYFLNTFETCSREARFYAGSEGKNPRRNLQIPPSPLGGSPEFVEKSTVLGVFMSEAFWLLLVTFWLHLTPLRRVIIEKAGYSF